MGRLETKETLEVQCHQVPRLSFHAVTSIVSDAAQYEARLLEGTIGRTVPSAKILKKQSFGGDSVLF